MRATGKSARLGALMLSATVASVELALWTQVMHGGMSAVQAAECLPVPRSRMKHGKRAGLLVGQGEGSPP